jgi:hypothetical protein
MGAMEAKGDNDRTAQKHNSTFTVEREDAFKSCADLPENPGNAKPIHHLDTTRLHFEFSLP